MQKGRWLELFSSTNPPFIGNDARRSASFVKMITDEGH
jgi:hypothetical protein